VSDKRPGRGGTATPRLGAEASLRRAPEDPARPAKRARRIRSRAHHSVYVVYLRDPKGDGKAGYYVGMTGLTPEARFANHKAGIKAASVVRRFGVRLVPLLYEHLNPMPYADAVRLEVELAESLRRRGFRVFGGH
jgi:predicted GIY-YIG superfamily endonuclease